MVRRELPPGLDAAYQLTLLMLGGGIVFSLAKGLDWEEALILAVMLAALAPCHRHFYRKTSLTAEPFTPGWSVAIAIVLLTAVPSSSFTVVRTRS